MGESMLKQITVIVDNDHICANCKRLPYCTEAKDVKVLFHRCYRHLLVGFPEMQRRLKQVAKKL